MSRAAVICAYKRSPFTFAGKGALASIRPDDLLAAVIRALIAQAGVSPKAIEDVIAGCAFPEGEQGFNIARVGAVLAGLPVSVAGMTVNRWCGSSMSAVHAAVGAIAADAGDVFVCAGVESMSRIPMGGFNPLPNPALRETYPQLFMSMGRTAETVARRYGVTRADQERFAYQSQQRAAAARAGGRFADEIVALGAATEDGCIRPETTVEGLGALKPSFDEEGTVTAGTSSPLTDGAAAVLVASEEYAKAGGLPVLARVKAVAVAGCEADVMGMAPVAVTQKILARTGLTMRDIDLVEINEAFAAQIVPVTRELGIDEARLNIDGGALALGHPLGASGARITGKLAALMKREGRRLGLAAMCIGGGQGTAVLLESV